MSNPADSSRDASTLVVAAMGNAVGRVDGRWCVHASFGRILTAIADRAARVDYHAPIKTEPWSHRDFALDHPRLRIIPLRGTGATWDALRHPFRLLREWLAFGRGADIWFFRGSYPLVWLGHLLARLKGKRCVHWIVGNPPAAVSGQDRGYFPGSRLLGWAYVALEQRLTWACAAFCGSTLLVNGGELARLFRSRRTIEVVSTNLSRDELRWRPDTCCAEIVEFLFVGHIRPEKGLPVLIDALGQMAAGRPWRFTIVGPWGSFPGEHARSVALVQRWALGDRVRWLGYVPYGPSLLDLYDKSDVLILPSLSEGTPRVLVEARGRCLPVIASRVGGVPSSVTDGVDGLLVPPGDAGALARALERMIQDGELRRKLIRGGWERAQRLTVEVFVEQLMPLLTGADPVR